MPTQGLWGEEWREQGTVPVHSSQGHPLLSDPPIHVGEGQTVSGSAPLD